MAIQFRGIIRSLLFQVLLTLGAGVLLAPYLPQPAICFFYSLSCVIKDLLIFFLPLVILSYLVSSIVAYEDSASKIIMGILGGIFVSMLIALGYAYVIGMFSLPHLAEAAHLKAVGEVEESITPLFTLPLRSLPTDLTMIVAFVIAFWLNVLRSSIIQRVRKSHYNKLEGQRQSAWLNAFVGLISFGIFATDAQLARVRGLFFKMRSISERALMRLFIPIVPVYIFGFILKISMEANSVHFLHSFTKIFVGSFLSIMLYVFLSYWLVARGSLHTAGQYLRNMFPAIITGFSTMSSVATMPLTIQATEKNMEDEGNFAKFVIPTTVNVHAIGDVINIAIAGLALLLMGGADLPHFGAYALFAVYTCLAQFSCVSVPGGGIFIMTGILQKHLGLSVEATMLLTSIYFLQEPFLTAANVAYNGAFTIGLKRWLRIR